MFNVSLKVNTGTNFVLTEALVDKPLGPDIPAVIKAVPLNPVDLKVKESEV